MKAQRNRGNLDYVPIDRGSVSSLGLNEEPRQRSEKSEPQNKGDDGGGFHLLVPVPPFDNNPHGKQAEPEAGYLVRNFRVEEDRHEIRRRQDHRRDCKDRPAESPASHLQEPCNQYRNQLGNRQKHRLEYAACGPEAESDKLPFEKLAVATGYGGESAVHAALPGT